MELLDGTLNLRHCTTLFTMRFHPWSLPRVGNGDGKRRLFTPDLLIEACGNMGKRVGLTKKTRPDALFYHVRDPGHPTPRRRKRLRSPSSDGVGGDVGRASQSFSSPWGWVSFALGMPGTCLRRLQA